MVWLCGSVCVCVRETAASKTTLSLIFCVPCPNPSKQVRLQASNPPLPTATHTHTPRHLPLSTARLPGRTGLSLRQNEVGIKEGAKVGEGKVEERENMPAAPFRPAQASGALSRLSTTTTHLASSLAFLLHVWCVVCLSRTVVRLRVWAMQAKRREGEGGGGGCDCHPTHPRG